MITSLLSRLSSFKASSGLDRLISLTNDRNTIPYDLRVERRCDRALPALIVPVVDGGFSVVDAVFGITQNLSENGMRILFLSEPMQLKYLITIPVFGREKHQVFHFESEVKNVEMFAPDIFAVGLAATKLRQDRELPLDVSALVDVYMSKYGPKERKRFLLKSEVSGESAHRVRYSLKNGPPEDNFEA